MSADLIIVLDKGKIAQQGTHNQLISKPGIYRELWGLQKGGYLGESVGSPLYREMGSRTGASRTTRCDLGGTEGSWPGAGAADFRIYVCGWKCEK